jgi:hypothetical protein
MVSGDENYNIDSKLTFDDPSYLSHCNASSLELNALCFLYMFQYFVYISDEFFYVLYEHIFCHIQIKV